MGLNLLSQLSNVCWESRVEVIGFDTFFAGFWFSDALVCIARPCDEVVRIMWVGRQEGDIAEPRCIPRSLSSKEGEPFTRHAREGPCFSQAALSSACPSLWRLA